jgi:hypothetical protein
MRSRKAISLRAGGIKDHNAAPPGHTGWVRNLRGAEHQTGANWKSATDEGVRAVVKSKPIDPETVERCLEGKFGEALAEVRKVLVELANAFDPDELAQQGFSLYEQFRPQIPEGVSGWGAKGELDLGRIRKLAHQDAGSTAN